MTIGRDIVIEAEKVAFGANVRVQGFPYPYIHNMGTILATKSNSAVHFNALVFTNSGVIRIGSGVVVTNNYPFEQTASGSLIFMAAGTTPGVTHGQLRNVREATLNGRVSLELAGQFQPAAGDMFELLTYASKQGVFSSVEASPLSGGLKWVNEYTPNAFRMSVSANSLNAFGQDASHFGEGEPSDEGDRMNLFPLTIMAWVKADGELTEYDEIVGKFNAESPNGYAVFLKQGRLRAWYSRDAARSVWPGEHGLDGGFIADGEWHHVAFVVDATGGVLYVDGQPAAEHGWNSETRVENGLAGPCTTSAPIRFGNHDAGARKFPGEISDINLWNAALTEAEINNERTHSDMSLRP